MSLKADYKDDIYEGSRRWRITPNEDGTSTITDATTYTQKGDKFGQNDVNAITGAINGMKNDKVITVPLFPQAQPPYSVDLAVENLKTTDAIELDVGLHPGDKGLSVAEKAAKLKMRRKSLSMIDDAVCNTDGTLTFTAYSKKPDTVFAVWLRGCSTE